MRITAVPYAAIAWILGRASSFNKHGRPDWTYARIAVNLKRSRLGIDLTDRQVRRIVAREAPELAQRRARAERTDDDAVWDAYEEAVERLSIGA